MQIGEIDVVVFIIGNDYYLYICYLCGSWVGVVCGVRDQVDIVMVFVVVFVIMVNCQQISIFILCVGVWLYVDGVIVGQFYQLVGKLGDYLLIFFCLFDWVEWVQFGEFWSGDWDYFCCGVQFYGVGVQWDYCLVQCQIFMFQGVYVVYYFGFVMVVVKYWMGEDCIVVQYCCWD